ncbi:ferredoxin-type protein NapF [Serratia odorifera]|uniref:ferredoxin-type protein NapF n=1 Tax=Serratia odorifera TaxID=618 RepID=UPI0023624347|nr:ferredoxin-type protein NapF [Serratia odorifera]
MAELSRRKLLSGQWRHPSTAIRPPWSLAESRFIAGCSRCQACINACETGVLRVGSGGYPEIDFTLAECTFCGDCASACDAALFHPLNTPPWRLHAVVDAGCLALRGVECRSCQDSCEPRAIRFRPRLGGVAHPTLNAIACNGCGACVAGCPTAAISLTRSEHHE